MSELNAKSRDAKGFGEALVLLEMAVDPAATKKRVQQLNDAQQALNKEIATRAAHSVDLATREKYLKDTALALTGDKEALARDRETLSQGQQNLADEIKIHRETSESSVAQLKIDIHASRQLNIRGAAMLEEATALQERATALMSEATILRADYEARMDTLRKAGS